MGDKIDPFQMLTRRANLISIAESRGLRDLVIALNAAEIVVWVKQTYDLATNGFEAHLSSPMTCRSPGKVELWHFGDFYIQGDDGRCSTDMLIIQDYEQKQILTTHVSSKPGISRVANNADEMEFTGDAPFTVGGYHGRATAARYLAMREFMFHPIAGIESINIPRQARRYMERQNEHVPLIRVVHLRERENGHKAQTVETARRRLHRWIQRWHWRKLPEPLKRDSKVSGGRKGDQVVFVRACVKGEGPLLPPRESIYAVTR